MAITCTCTSHNIYTYAFHQGIPADDIFDNFDDDVMDDGRHDNFMDDEAAEVDDNDDGDIIQSRKRRRFDSEGEDPGVSDLINDEHSNQSDARLSTPLADDQPTNEIAPPAYFKKPGPVFSEKMVEKCHAPFQSSSTPEHLQHRFMVSCQALIIYVHVYMMLYSVYMYLHVAAIVTMSEKFVELAIFCQLAYLFSMKISPALLFFFLP